MFSDGVGRRVKAEASPGFINRLKFVAVDVSQVAYFSRCFWSTSILKPDDKSVFILSRNGRPLESHTSRELINQNMM